MMSAPMVSSFYDMNDVIHQSKLRPASLDLRQRFERKPTNPLLSRRHSTNSAGLTVPIGKQSPISPASSNFFPMPPSPKEQFYGNMSPALLRERAASASVQEEIEAQHRKRGSNNSSRYKTELCRPFEENGSCKYGDKCQFAHGMHELRGLNRHPKYKTEYCRTYHTIGFCPYGPRCHFIHNDEEKRLPSMVTDRPNSMSSLGDSTSSSPLIDAAPSPFGNSLTPPTSPGYGGDVFLFDESHIGRAPLAVCGQKFGHMATIAESMYPGLEAGDFQPMSPPGMERSERMPVPVAALKRSAMLSRDHALQGASTERGDCGSYPSSNGSVGSAPPSPVDSLDGALDDMTRLSVFGFIR